MFLMDRPMNHPDPGLEPQPAEVPRPPEETEAPGAEAPDRGPGPSPLRHTRELLDMIKTDQLAIAIR